MPLTLIVIFFFAFDSWWRTTEKKLKMYFILVFLQGYRLSQQHGSRFDRQPLPPPLPPPTSSLLGRLFSIPTSSLSPRVSSSQDSQASSSCSQYCRIDKRAVLTTTFATPSSPCSSAACQWEWLSLSAPL